MEQAYAIAAVWFGLALAAAIVAHHIRVSMALVEICLGMVAAWVAEQFFHPEALGTSQEWLRFVASVGAVVLTFLAGAELDPASMRLKLKEVLVVGLFGFFSPFLGCMLLARYVLGWDSSASWLAGIALSTTSMAVVYAVMLETGFNKTEFGKGILGACFVNDLGTVIALGLLFAPFTWKTAVFVAACVLVVSGLPFLMPRLIQSYGNRTAAIRTKFILLILFGLGALAIWSGSEAVLPAYLAGMALAEAVGRDHSYTRRLRTLTLGFLAPFYFIRAGALASLPAILAAPGVFLLLFGGKAVSKILGLVPIVGMFRSDAKERWYYTLMMSTGLTFGTISAMYGYNHGIVDRTQYSLLVAAVIASAVVPTLLANALFLPRHLIPTIAWEGDLSDSPARGTTPLPGTTAGRDHTSLRQEEFSHEAA